MIFEVIEYIKDENGTERILTTYEISARDYSITVNRLDGDVWLGRISSYAITQVF